MCSNWNKFPVFHFPEKLSLTAVSIQQTCQCHFLVPFFTYLCWTGYPTCSNCHTVSLPFLQFGFFVCLPQFANSFLLSQVENLILYKRIFWDFFSLYKVYMILMILYYCLWFFTIASPSEVSPAAFMLVWPVWTTLFLEIFFLENLLSVWGILLPPLFYRKDWGSSMTVLLLPSILLSN